MGRSEDTFGGVCPFSFIWFQGSRDFLASCLPTEQSCQPCVPRLVSTRESRPFIVWGSHSVFLAVLRLNYRSGWPRTHRDVFAAVSWMQRLNTLLGLFGDRLWTGGSQKMAIAHVKQSPSYGEMQTQLTEPSLKDWAEYWERCTRVPGQMEVIRGPKGAGNTSEKYQHSFPLPASILKFSLWKEQGHTCTEHYKDNARHGDTHTFSPTIWEVDRSGLHDQPQSCETLSQNTKTKTKNHTHKS